VAFSVTALGVLTGVQPIYNIGGWVLLFAVVALAASLALGAAARGSSGPRA
jgi:hypothetical protein